MHWTKRIFILLWCGAAVVLYFFKQSLPGSPSSMNRGSNNLQAESTRKAAIVDYQGNHDIQKAGIYADQGDNDTASAIQVCQATKRERLLNSMCHTLHINTYSSIHHHMLVSEKHRYVACLSPKAGCTSWKTIMVNNSVEHPLPHDFFGMHLHRTIKRYGFKVLTTYSTERQRDILRDYYKFMVVRHPLDRLLSAYNEKVVQENYMNVKNRIRNVTGESVSFPSFLKYVVRSHQLNLTELELDSHFTSSAILCDACNIRYDKIIKLETQSHDLTDVLPHLGPYGRRQAVPQNVHRRSEADTMFTRILSAYKDVSTTLLQDVLGIGFQYDLQLFGYSWSNVSSTEGLIAKCSSEDAHCC